MPVYELSENDLEVIDLLSSIWKTEISKKTSIRSDANCFFISASGAASDFRALPDSAASKTRRYPRHT